jgi:hypothetical protein
MPEYVPLRQNMFLKDIKSFKNSSNLYLCLKAKVKLNIYEYINPTCDPSI